MSAQPAFDREKWLAEYRRREAGYAKYSPWMQKVLRDMDRRIEREKFDQMLAGYRRAFAEFRRGDERSGVEIARSNYEYYKKRRERTGEPVPIKVLMDLHRVQKADIVLPGDEADVARWRAHVAALAAQHQIEVKYVVIAQQNAYALTGGKQQSVELPPLNNVEAYAAALHEIGHCVRPCTSAHVRAKTKDGTRTVCVECEMNSWSFAIDHAEPYWTRGMHAELSRCLPSYRTYGTAEQQAAIDLLCARGYYDGRLRRLSRSH